MKLITMTLRKLRFFLLCMLLFNLSACMNIEPWVSPFERDALADPIMSFSRGPADAAYMHHVHQAREGARGAEGGAGGGCGCN